MYTRITVNVGIVATLCLLCATPAMASFHLMQIEKVIGSVNGDTSAQAIQLRMRATGQDLVSQGRLVAFNASGTSPIVIVDMTTDVTNDAAGTPILIASPAFLALTTPATTADFTMTNLIPPSYLAAGRLVFQNDAGTQILWSISWGGAGYTGSTSGATTNDTDGNFGPSISSSLPGSGVQAFQLSIAAAVLSTNNAADYTLVSQPIVFANNAGASFTLTDIPGTAPTLNPGSLIMLALVLAATAMCVRPMVSGRKSHI
jgi:hypothetical protein